MGAANKQTATIADLLRAIIEADPSAGKGVGEYLVIGSGEDETFIFDAETEAPLRFSYETWIEKDGKRVRLDAEKTTAGASLKIEADVKLLNGAKCVLRGSRAMFAAIIEAAMPAIGASGSIYDLTVKLSRQGSGKKDTRYFAEIVSNAAVAEAAE